MDQGVLLILLLLGETAMLWIWIGQWCLLARQLSIDGGSVWRVFWCSLMLLTCSLHQIEMKRWHVDIKHCYCFETYRIECHPTTMSRFNLFKNWEAFVVEHIIHVSKTGPAKISWKLWVLVEKHLEKAERKVNPGRRDRMLLWILVMGCVWTFPPPIYHL